MGFEIEGSTGNPLQITSEYQALVRSENHELQHHISWNDGEVYQAQAVDTGITAESTTLLHLKNTSSTHDLVISFIRVQAITNTASKPVVGEYFTLGFDETLTSGGTTITPVNTNNAGFSGNVADVIATGVDPVMGGTFVEIDRWYNEGNGEKVWNKQGSIIIGKNRTFSVKFLSAGTGEAKARVTFSMMKKDRI